MRITRETLLKIARDTAEKQARRSRDLVCIYATGSLVTESPLLGGTADIDLIYVHTGLPPYEREIVRLTEEVHLDIAHYSQTVYHQPRNLRTDPWIGSYLCEDPLVLHDVSHWFEYTQASAGAGFYQPEYILPRALKMAGMARQGWLDMLGQEPTGQPAQVWTYLKTIEDAANTVAVFSGPPLTERRFLLLLPERANRINRPGLAAGFTDLLHPAGFDRSSLHALLEPWRACLQAAAAAEKPPARLNPARLAYYERAADALDGESPSAALWLVLRTWTRAVHWLGQQSEHLQPWQQACLELELSPAHWERRQTALDAYLDAVEETVDNYAKETGAAP